MGIERHFIEENMKKLLVRKFTTDRLSRSGCGNVSISRTPLGVRVTIFAERPGLIIGSKGKNIQSLTEAFQEKFNLENPQLDVQQVEVPQLNPTLMAQRIASAMERGIHFRRAVYSTMRQIKEAGALGVQITVSGKISGERARATKFLDGFIKHTGDMRDDIVLKGFAGAKLKAGILGIGVKIVPPGVILPEIKAIEAETGPAKLTELKPEAGAKPEEKEKKPGAMPEAKKPEKEEKPKPEQKGKPPASEKKPAMPEKKEAKPEMKPGAKENKPEEKKKPFPKAKQHASKKAKSPAKTEAEK